MVEHPPASGTRRGNEKCKISNAKAKMVPSAPASGSSNVVRGGHQDPQDTEAGRNHQEVFRGSAVSEADGPGSAWPDATWSTLPRVAQAAGLGPATETGRRTESLWVYQEAFAGGKPLRRFRSQFSFPGFFAWLKRNRAQPEADRKSEWADSCKCTHAKGHQRFPLRSSLLCWSSTPSAQDPGLPALGRQARDYRLRWSRRNA